MLTIKVDGNIVTITRGPKQRSSVDDAKAGANGHPKPKTAPIAETASEKDTADVSATAKGSGDGGGTGPGGGDGGGTGPGGGDGGATGPAGGDGGGTGPGGGSGGSVLVVGPIIMTGSTSGNQHSNNSTSVNPANINPTNIASQGQLGATHDATAPVNTHQPTASEATKKDERGGGDGGGTGPGGGGFGSVLVIGPIVIQDFSSTASSDSDSEEVTEQIDKPEPQQAKAATNRPL